MSRASAASLLVLLLLAPVAGAQPVEAPGAERGVEGAGAAETGAEGPPALFADPNRSHYLLVPSALLLERGEVALSQRGLLLTHLAVGVSEHVTLQAGTVLPLLGSEHNHSLTAGVLAGWQVREGLRVAGSLEGVLLPRLFTNTFPAKRGLLASALATFGGIDAHLTVSLGGHLGLGNALVEENVGSLRLAVSGSLRIGSHTALVTEHWGLLTPGRGPTPIGKAMTMHGLALRLLDARMGLDLGLVLPREVLSGGLAPLMVTLPLPWLSFSYTFGGR
jgi:hypothetical protein